MRQEEGRLSRTAVSIGLKSAFAWLLVFCYLGAGFALTIPARNLSAADGVSGTIRVLVAKLASFLPSAEQPDVVLLGSSLVLVPAVRCDDQLLGKTPCYDRWYYDRYIPCYSQSVYLQKQLQDKFGLTLRIKNLGVASSIMSDQCGIFKLMLSEGKRPGLLILGLAPRDFLDNSQQKHLQTPTRTFIHEYSQASLLPEKCDPAGLLAAGSKITHRFEKVFGRIRSECTDLACRLTGHPSQAEVNTTAAAGGDRPNRLVDVETYRKLYNPPNFTMLAQQSNYLEQLLATARENRISVLVINMPLTRENTDTLDRQALAAYQDTLANLTTKYGAGFLNIGSGSADYSLKDFEDCCHLNTRGGEKLYASLVSYLDNNHELLSALSARKSVRRQIAAGPLSGIE
jgi:hypothetical protein